MQHTQVMLIVPQTLIQLFSITTKMKRKREQPLVRQNDVCEGYLDLITSENEKSKSKLREKNEEELNS